MYMFAEKPKTLQQTTSTRSTSTRHRHPAERHDVSATLQLQRMLGNQVGGGRPGGGGGVLQARLAVNRPGDQYEQEADRVADRVMRMEATDVARNAPPSIQRLDARYEGGVEPGHLQRLCAECEEDAVQRRSSPISDGAPQGSRPAETLVDAVRGGEPLTREQRAFFEPRFGADFSHVRVHTGGSADAAARSIGAYAYTRGSDIVFRGDQYHPNTFAGRHMLAHELTHVVQQGAAPRAHDVRGSRRGEQRQVEGSHAHTGATSAMVQCWPGDGMTPPGDCGWARYLLLRGSVETAKAVVSSLGGCSPDDGCTLLATKIAAISAEIAARLALDTTCFRGGDEGHRQQVQDKVNMMNRCYRFFDGSNCPPELVAAMAVVVEAAREAIAAAAVAVTLALIVALIAAIIALAEAIAAALAAAAEGAAAAAAVAAVIALLVAIKEEITES